MRCFVVSIDDEKYQSTKAHLANWGLGAEKWPGFTPDDVELSEWRGARLRNHEKRQAIVHTYLALFKSLRGNGPWLIVQDDVRFTDRPVHDKPLTMYSGAHLYRMSPSPDGWYRSTDTKPFEVDPFGGHLCPVAFSIEREAVDAIIPLLADDNQICVKWAPYVAPATTAVGPTIAFEALNQPA